MDYNPTMQFCHSNGVYSKCGGKEYDPSNHMCQGDVLMNRCGGGWLNPSTQYCSEGAVKNYGSVAYEGKNYKTVVIGAQAWMAENLNYNASGSKCYDNQESYCDKYGRLYDWATAMGISSVYNSSYNPSASTKYRGVCPSGWHIPNDGEWEMLIDYAGGSSVAGNRLRATSGWNNGGNGTDTYGFSALPGGVCWPDDAGSGYHFSDAGSYGGYWWSATEGNSYAAYRRRMIYGDADVGRGNDDKTILLSVRCLNDQCVNGYSSPTQRCQGGVAETKCGSEWHNPATQFCSDNSIYDRCGGKAYSPSDQRCQNGVVMGKCGSDLYDYSTQFCSDNSVYSKCGEQTYFPSSQGCDGGVVKTKCGSDLYDASNTNLRCQFNVLETKCGTNWYNSTQFCHTDNTVHIICGGSSDYNVSTQYCSEGTVKNYDGYVAYEGKNYKTVVIGEQTWMAENLNYASEGSRCHGDNTGGDSQGRCNTYGRLYDWSTALQLPSKCNSIPSIGDAECAIAVPHQGVCPSGWHIPSNADWNTLMKYVNPDCSDNSTCAGAGTKLKASSGWNAYSGVPAGTDAYGFSALPVGIGGSDGSFSIVGGYDGYWWSSSEYYSYYAYYRYMVYDNEDVNYNYYDKSYLFSVRCLRD
jgi:uncharacterized protein (TIGR02145 family)